MSTTDLIAASRTPSVAFFPRSALPLPFLPTTAAPAIAIIPIPRAFPSPVITTFSTPPSPPSSPPSAAPYPLKRSRLPSPDSPTFPSFTSKKARFTVGYPCRRSPELEGTPRVRVRKGCAMLEQNLESLGSLDGFQAQPATLATMESGAGAGTGIGTGVPIWRPKPKMRLSLQTNIPTPIASSSASSAPTRTSLEDLTTARPGSDPSSDMPPSPSSIGSPRSSSSRNSSPPAFTSPANRKRNPKRLSLTIPMPEAGPSTSIALRRSLTPPSDNDATPFTPGPPQTPGAAVTLGRHPKSSSRRPTLLSLITQPPTAYDPVPPTPIGLSSHPYATIRNYPRRRSNTTEDPPAIGIDPRSSRSAYPRLATAFAPIDEMGPRVTSPAATSSSSTETLSSTSSSPPLPHIETPYASRSNEPYINGPIEIVPGVYLGAEDSMYHWSTWARSRRVRILNVAQEIDNPFDTHSERSGSVISRKGKGKVQRFIYPENQAEGIPEIDYCHLEWSHGEAGLAELDDSMKLGDVIKGEFDETEVEGREKWRFWEAIRFMEAGRQKGEAILIHCQCGVSRSATLVIAYTMALAASGLMPEYLGHLKGMQDTYDFVKSKSCWIGPNVSLVFQLVEFARNLTTLISRHIATGPVIAPKTSFPSAEQVAQSEADWARQRALFDQDQDDLSQSTDQMSVSISAISDPTVVSVVHPDSPSSAYTASVLGPKLGKGIQELRIDEEGMKREARALDEAMRRRRVGRV